MPTKFHNCQAAINAGSLTVCLSISHCVASPWHKLVIYLSLSFYLSPLHCVASPRHKLVVYPSLLAAHQRIIAGLIWKTFDEAFWIVRPFGLNTPGSSSTA